MKNSVIIAMFLFAIVFGLELIFRFTNLGMQWNMDQFGRRADSAQMSTSNNKMLVTTGDSLTFGMRIKESDAYPSQLEQKLINRHISVVNTGISGHTSAQLIERLYRDVISYKPSTVVLWIGTNDGMLKKEEDLNEPGKRPFDKPPLLAKSALLITIDSIPLVMNFISQVTRGEKYVKRLVPRVSIDRFEINVQNILNSITRQGIKEVILITIPKVPDHYSRNHELIKYQRIMHNRYNEVLKRIATIEGVVLIDLWDLLLEEHFLADGLHLNKSGYEIVAAQVFRHMQLDNNTQQDVTLDVNFVSLHSRQ
jgi:lysophospholipase L1-like esterase